jgi:hypothetical protein
MAICSIPFIAGAVAKATEKTELPFLAHLNKKSVKKKGYNKIREPPGKSYGD